MPPSNRQSGVALVVSLILLLMVTLLGLAAIRGASTQHNMSGRYYDLEMAFQRAETGLSAGAAQLGNDVNGIVNCAGGGQVCTLNPFTNPDLPANAIQVASKPDFSAGSKAPGQPQYVIEFMGKYANTATSTGFGQSANSAQYGAQGVSTTNTYYRITARSSDPTASGNRASVTLQALYAQ